MKRTVAVLVAALVVAASVPAMAALGASQPSEEAPGATFAGVVGVQEAELGGELAQRSFEHRLDRANSSGSKAAVVADQQDRIQERLTELEQRRQALNESYQNGEISRQQYEARLAAIATQVRNLEQRANRTAEVAQGLPEEALRNHGVNVTELRRLAHRASELGGGEVAAAARNVAGPGVGQGMSSAPGQKGADRGKDARNASEGAGNQSAGTGQGDGQAADGQNASDGTGSDGAGSGSQAGDAGGQSNQPTDTPTATDNSTSLGAVDRVGGW